MKVANFFLLTAVFFLSAGCASNKTSENQRDLPLAGTVWIPEKGPSGAYLEFSGDMLRIIGSTGGNRFFAPVEKVCCHLIHFGSIASTRMMSREPEKEALFLDALDRTRAWKTDGNTLIFENERKKEVIKFIRASHTVPKRRDK